MNAHQKQVAAGFSIMFFTLTIGFAVGVLVAHQTVDKRLTEAQELMKKIENKTVKICE